MPENRSVIRFAHMADVHLDAWREPELKDLNIRAFIESLDICKSENVDFILISGDLFHVSTPDIEIMRRAVEKIRELKDSGISFYIIPGSHDFSYSEKTMLNVLEAAGLFTNVSKGKPADDNKIQLKITVDEKTGAKITGLLGRAGSLEKDYYESLDRKSLENEQGFKIFMFHSAIEEYKPEFLKDIHALQLSYFPKGFDYYAGGHVHEKFERDEPGYGKIAFPGALYPVKFDELEKYKKGGFYILDYDTQKNRLESRYIELEPHRVISLRLDLDSLTPKASEEKIRQALQKQALSDAIVLIRLKGTLSSGKPSDIDLNSISEYVKSEGALTFKRSTTNLTAREFEEIKIESKGDIKEIESRLIDEHIGKTKISTPDEKKSTLDLMHSLSSPKGEEETAEKYARRTLSDLKKILAIDDIES